MTPNNLSKGGRSWMSPLIHLSNNWISLVGVVLVTTTTVLWLFLLPVTLKGETENPYLGMVAFLTIPGPFFGGLMLIPLGMWLKRRREGQTGISPPEFPTSVAVRHTIPGHPLRGVKAPPGDPPTQHQHGNMGTRFCL